MAHVDRMPTTTSIGQALPSVLIDGGQTLQRLPTRASVEHEVIGTDAKSCLSSIVSSLYYRAYYIYISYLSV